MHQWILRCLALKKTIFTILILLLVACSFGIQHLEFTYTISPIDQNAFKQQIEFVVVHDKHLLNRQHLQKLAQMQQALSNIHSISKITSLYTIPNLRRYFDENQWHSMIENQAYTPSELNQLKQDVLSNDLLIGKFINKQADTMIFYLYTPFDRLGHESVNTREKIQAVLNHYQNDFSTVFQTGFLDMTYSIAKKTQHDLLYCIPSIFIIMALLFGWLFRNIFLALLPLSSSFIGIFCALGIMGIVGIPANSLLIVAIVLTLAISIAESAHMIHAYQKSKTISPEGKMHDHFAFILKAVLFPFLLAIFSTLLGCVFDILSFVKIIEEMVAAFALCLFFNTMASIFIAPLILSMITIKKSPHSQTFNFISRKLIQFNRYASSHAKRITVGLLIITIGSFIFAQKITIESLPYVFFKKNDSFIQNIKFLDENISGSNILQVKIYSTEKNIFLDPYYLQKVLAAEAELLKLANTSHTYTAADVIATTNEIFLFNTKRFHKIPNNPELLKLFYQALSQNSFIDSLVNKDFNELTLNINHSIYSSNTLALYNQAITTTLRASFLDTPIHFKITDYWSTYGHILDNLLLLQITSIFSIYLICFLIVGLLYRSFVAGILSIAPNIFPLCIIAITQYMLNIPASMLSVILYSIFVGISIDETIHIFYAFRTHYLETKNKCLAIEKALESQVIPVTIASTAITIACFALLFSQFLPAVQLGFLIGIGIFSAWFSDLVITPFLLQKIDITKRLK